MSLSFVYPSGSVAHSTHLDMLLRQCEQVVAVPLTVFAVTQFYFIMRPQGGDMPWSCNVDSHSVVAVYGGARLYVCISVW